MKKLFCCILAFVLCLSAVGCKPNNVSDSCYNDGILALDIFDKYWDTELTSSEAYEKLSAITDRMNPNNDYTADGTIESAIHLMKSQVIGKYPDALETRNELAERLGKKKRQ